MDMSQCKENSKWLEGESGFPEVDSSHTRFGAEEMREAVIQVAAGTGNYRPQGVVDTKQTKVDRLKDTPACDRIACYSSILRGEALCSNPSNNKAVKIHALTYGIVPKPIRTCSLLAFPGEAVTTFHPRDHQHRRKS